MHFLILLPKNNISNRHSKLNTPDVAPKIKIGNIIHIGLPIFDSKTIKPIITRSPVYWLFHYLKK